MPWCRMIADIVGRLEPLKTFRIFGKKGEDRLQNNKAGNAPKCGDAGEKKNNSKGKALDDGNAVVGG